MPKKSTKKHSKVVKFLKTSPYSVIVVSAILFLSLVGFVFGYYNFNDQKTLTNDRGVEGDSSNRELIDSYPTPTSNVAKVVTPTPKPTIVQSPQVSLTGPSIKDKDSYVEFTYTIKVNEVANNSYPTISYNINVDGCEGEEIFETNTGFSGKLDKSDNLSRSFTVSIKSDYLKSKSDLRTDPYSLSSGSSNILTGVIGVPRCKSQDDNGSFSIGSPEIDSDLLPGKLHFSYSFIMDGKARDLLEKGFTHKIKHDCDKWLDGKDYFESKWDPGKLGNVGFAVNIDDDAFDSDDLTESSTYTILDKDGKVVFSGKIEVPKCKD